MPTITITLSKEEMDQLISGALVECKVLPSMKPGSKFYLKVENKYEMPPKTPEDSIKESLSIDIPFSRMTFADLACESRLKDRPWEVQGTHYVYAVGSFHQFKSLKEILDRVSDKLQRNLYKKKTIICMRSETLRSSFATRTIPHILKIKDCIWMRSIIM